MPRTGKDEKDVLIDLSASLYTVHNVLNTAIEDTRENFADICLLKRDVENLRENISIISNIVRGNAGLKSLDTKIELVEVKLDVLRENLERREKEITSIRDIEIALLHKKMDEIKRPDYTLRSELIKGAITILIALIAIGGYSHISPAFFSLLPKLGGL